RRTEKQERRGGFEKKNAVSYDAQKAVPLGKPRTEPGGERIDAQSVVTRRAIGPPVIAVLEQNGCGIDDQHLTHECNRRTREAAWRLRRIVVRQGGIHRRLHSEREKHPPEEQHTGKGVAG